jgi:hypothetical protein
MSVVDWSLTHRIHADSLLTRVRAAATRLAERLGRRWRRGPDTVIRVPPISTDWVRAYERRGRGDP